MLSPLLRAVGQLDDPVFLGVVWRSLAASAAVFAALLAGSVWGTNALLGQPGWWGWAAGALSGVGAFVLALWLFVPVALVIATFFIDRVAAAVDRRFYPGLPAPRGAKLAIQGWDGIALGLQVLALNVVALLVAVALAPVLPGISLLLGWLIAGWAIGRGLFVAVAMRRMCRAEALAQYGRQRVPVIAQGVLLALAGTVPLVNLLVPVLGTAGMVHVLHRPPRSG